MAKKKIDMVTLRCDAIPTLLITTPHVQFEDGLATVPAADAEIILDVLGDDFGITGTAATSSPTRRQRHPLTRRVRPPTSS